MNNKKLAGEVVRFLGGKDNISNALHCVTRLRFNLKDESLADLKSIGELDGED